MTWFKSNAPGSVLLLARAEFADDPGSLGDAREEILPGESAAGLSYEQWRALPDGPVVLRFEDGRAVAVEAAPPGPAPEPPS